TLVPITIPSRSFPSIAEPSNCPPPSMIGRSRASQPLLKGDAYDDDYDWKKPCTAGAHRSRGAFRHGGEPEAAERAAVSKPRGSDWRRERLVRAALAGICQGARLPRAAAGRRGHESGRPLPGAELYPEAGLPDEQAVRHAPAMAGSGRQ